LQHSFLAKLNEQDKHLKYKPKVGEWG